jgi:hypothetical protein
LWSSGEPHATGRECGNHLCVTKPCVPEGNVLTTDLGDLDLAFFLEAKEWLPTPRIQQVAAVEVAT